jgi:hypothetical protein
MIKPSRQWGLQIDVTNACGRACSNCTRLVGHSTKTWFMDLDTFANACQIGREFLERSDPDAGASPPRQKVVGVIGGEPLLHPDFPDLCKIIAQTIPDRRQRGLWTAIPLLGHKYEGLIYRTFGYLNHNPHTAENPSRHQPVLVAIQDVIQDDAEMWRLIERCPLQREWCSSINPDGFYFCEVAAAMERVDGRPLTAIPAHSGCWSYDLESYAKQKERWCYRCGMALPLVPRLDSERRDDISATNLRWLKEAGSPRVAGGRYLEYDPRTYAKPNAWKPLHYMETTQ